MWEIVFISGPPSRDERSDWRGAPRGKEPVKAPPPRDERPSKPGIIIIISSLIKERSLGPGVLSYT